MSLDELGKQIADEQDAMLARSDSLERVRDRLAREQRPRPRRVPARSIAFGLAAALAVAAVAVVFVFFFVRTRSAVLAFNVSGEPGRSGAWIETPPSAVTSVHFSDGTHFALRDNARARVESVTENGAHLALERGALSADVVHRETSQWSVFAGPYEVHVTGTQFEVGWEPSASRLHVHVTRGSVRVSGAAMEPRALHAGESLVVEPRATGQSDVEPAPTKPEISNDVVRSPPPVVVGPPHWQQLAAAGKYSDAVDAVRKFGSDRIIAASGPADLLLLADAARLSGHVDIADESLRALRARYPKDSRAAHAAFDLGRLAFDHDRDYRTAATWFETSLREDPNGTFDREASGRLIEARKKAGDEPGARDAAKDYLARYPDGPHAPLARSMITGP